MGIQLQILAALPPGKSLSVTSRLEIYWANVAVFEKGKLSCSSRKQIIVSWSFTTQPGVYSIYTNPPPLPTHNALHRRHIWGFMVTTFTGILQLVCCHDNDRALILTDAINTLPWLHSRKVCDRLHNTCLNGHLVALVTILY